ncbi:hypothetical protein Ahia01_000350200 [Argonauta hians]
MSSFVITVWKLLWLTTVMILSQCVADLKDMEFKHVHQVTDSNFKSSKGFKMIYYYMGNSETIPLEERKGFLKVIDEAAGILRGYDFKVGLVDCSVVEDDQCTKADLDTKVYFYNGDVIWSSIPVINMFNVDSVMSYAMLVLLIEDLEIFYNRIERIERVATYQGTKNIMFAYLYSIGTVVHRLILELTYVIKDEIQFMFTTTQRTISDLEQHDGNKTAMIWFFMCKDVPKNERISVCPTVLFRGNITYRSLFSAVKLVNGPQYYYLPENESNIPCNSSNCLYLFHSRDDRANMEKIGESVLKMYLGVFALILVDVDSEKLSSSLQIPATIPTAAIALAGDNMKTYMDTSFSNKSLMVFLQNYIAASVNQTSLTKYNRNYEQLYFSNDDEVTNVVLDLKDQEYKNGIQVLTGQTFEDIKHLSHLTLVIFNLPYNPVYTAFMHHLMEWKAENEAQFSNLSIASFNCFDWTDICQKLNIIHTPILRLYGKKPGTTSSITPIDYSGTLNPKDVIAFLYLHHFDEALHLKEEDVPDLLSGQFKAMSAISSHCLLGLFEEDSEELKNFLEAARQKQGTILFSYLTGDNAKNFAATIDRKIPSVMAIRWHDENKLVSYLKSSITPETVATFAETSKLETFGELNPDLLPQIYNSNKTLCIFFWKTSSNCEKAFTAVEKVSMDMASEKIVFMHINLASSYKRFATHLFETYFQTPAVPALSMVYFSEQSVYNYENQEFSSGLVLKWIKKLNRERTQIKSSYVMENNSFEAPLASTQYFKYFSLKQLEETAEESKMAETGDTAERSETEEGKDTSSLSSKKRLHAEL